MEYLLGIDIGTSGTKTVLFDRDANPITAKTFEYPLYQEQNGWAEQEPEDWYRFWLSVRNNFPTRSYFRFDR